MAESPGQMITTSFMRVILQCVFCSIMGAAVGWGETPAEAGARPLRTEFTTSIIQGRVTGDAQAYPVQGVKPPPFERPQDTWAFQSCISPHGYLVPRIPRGKRGEVFFEVRNCGTSTSITVELSVTTCPVDVLCQLPKREVTVDPAGFHTSEGIVAVVDIPGTMKFGRYPLQIKGVSSDRTRYLDLAFDVTN